MDMRSEFERLFNNEMGEEEARRFLIDLYECLTMRWERKRRAGF